MGFSRLLEEVDLRVVDHIVRPYRPGKLDLLRRCRGDHAGTVPLGELQSRCPTPPAAAIGGPLSWSPHR